VRRPLRIGATIAEVHAQGVKALALAGAAAAFAGMALALQFGTGLARFGAQGLLPPLVALGLFRELCPVVIGLVVGSRLGAGIAAELGSMAVTEQLDAIRVLGADPVKELAVPRLLAATVTLPLVTILGDVVGIGGAMLVAWTEHGLGARYFLTSARERVTLSDFTTGIGKAAAFGLAIALVACWHGGRAREGTAGVGRATTRTVVQGALTVIALDYFLSRLFALKY
jgi:phospholipid/cholesterol/gamma-HCH transport system permease protein